MLSANEKLEKGKRILSYIFFSDKKKSELLSDLLDEKKETVKSELSLRTSKVKTVTARNGRPTKDNITIGLLKRERGATIEEIVDSILKYYPEEKTKTKIVKGKTILVIEETTKRRVSNYLKSEKGYNVISSDGIYFIVSKIRDKNGRFIKTS